jgi:hypothetical protein
MTTRLLALVPLVLTAACPQAPPRVTPPPSNRSSVEIAVGQTTAGTLTLDAPTFADGSHYRAYPFTGRGGDTITADVESVDFDANVILTDGHGNRLSANDDSGGDCNARLTFVLPRDGAYRLYVNSSATAELGPYQLALRRGGDVVVPDSTCRGFGRVKGLVRIGQTIADTLTDDDPIFSGDSSHFQRWVLPVTRGQTFTVDLTSQAFDAYLILTHGPGDKILENDDGGDDCNARIVYTPLDDRPLRVLVNSAHKHETGPYTLRVSTGPTLTDVKGQCLSGP